MGSVLVPKLIEKGYKVKVLDWYIYGNDVLTGVKNKNLLQEIKGDIRDVQLVKKELQGIDAVIHLACISNDPSFELDPALGKSINYDATYKLVEEAKKAGVSRFIYASSSSVYGVKKEMEVTEDLPLEPLTDYSKYKVLCEKYLLEKATDDFCVLILRPATVCGYSPRLRLDLTVNILTIGALVNKRMTIFGGSQLRPNIHIDDMADIYKKALEYPDSKICGKVFNVGYQNYTLVEIARMIKKTLGDDSIKIEILPSKDPRSYKISSGKIDKELGFRPQKGIEQAIKDLKIAYEKGKIPNAFENIRYYNIRMMRKLGMK